MSVPTNAQRQFAIHAHALPDNPDDRHTHAQIIPAIEQMPPFD
jgi:hypothetical protein